MPGRRIRVVHCDDSPSFLVLVKHWFEDHPDLELVHSALGLRDAIEQIRALQPDVIVTDTFGSAGDAASLAWLHDAAPGARLVVFTGYRESQLHADLVALADAVVTKGLDEDALVGTIRRIAGERSG